MPPDGTYKGRYGGYAISVEYNGRLYIFETEDGVRGFNIPMTVTIENGKASFEIDE